MNKPEIYIGDCIDIMQSMDDGIVDLIATDPPYGTGKDFGAYNDKRDDYLKFMEYVLIECHFKLKDTGSIYVQCDWRYSHNIRVLLDDIFGRNNFRNEIIWCYVGLGQAKKQFPRKHDTILFYAKSNNNVFNIDAVRVPYPESSLGRAKYKNSGIFKEFMSNIRLHPDGKVVEDYWTDISPAYKSSKERTGYPTQKPLKLYERIIKASSNEGDVILDPFCGSGTTLIAASRLNRKSIGIDINEDVRDIIEARYDQENKA